MVIRGSFLEIGTGSGVIAKHCVDSGASTVVAVDINPYAVEHARNFAVGAEGFIRQAR